MRVSLRKKVFIGAMVVCANIAVACVTCVCLLTDARLTGWARALLNRHFSGHFEVARVHYGFPGSLSIQDVRAQSPDGAPVAAIDKVLIQARLLPLWVGRAVIDDVTVDGVRVDMVLPEGDEKSQFLSTFIPDFELPALRNISTPVRLEVRRLTLENIDLMVKGPAGARARLRNLRVSDASMSMAGDALDSSFVCTADASAQKNGAIFEESPIAVRVRDAHLHFASLDMALGSLATELPGLQTHIEGQAHFAEDGGVDADMRGDVTLDSEHLLAKMPELDGVKKAVRGGASLRFEGQHTGQAGEAKIALGDHDLQVQWLPLRTLTMALSHKGRELSLDALKLALGEGTLEGHGKVTLGTDPNILLAQHDIALRAHAMAVRDLARPVIKLAALLPQAVSFAVVSQGRALWPPTSQVDVDVVPEGLPGEDWPGLPKAMELKGRFLTHPDLLEILKLEVAIDKVPDFAIQGALPMHQQSIFEIIHELHGPNPKGPLRRIPVAPTKKRP